MKLKIKTKNLTKEGKVAKKLFEKDMREILFSSMTARGLSDVKVTKALVKRGATKEGADNFFDSLVGFSVFEMIGLRVA